MHFETVASSRDVSLVAFVRKCTIFLVRSPLDHIICIRGNTRILTIERGTPQLYKHTN